MVQSGAAVIGLFEGMLGRNVLTFNPGWDRAGNRLSDFTDVRELQRQLRVRGLEPETPVDETTAGPASFILIDPDGNPILVDQHV